MGVSENRVPKIGDPKIVPEIAGFLIIRTPKYGTPSFRKPRYNPRTQPPNPKQRVEVSVMTNMHWLEKVSFMRDFMTYIRDQGVSGYFYYDRITTLANICVNIVVITTSISIRIIVPKP